MPCTLAILPCNARFLETALHNYCDHHGAWDAEVRVCLHKPQGVYSLYIVPPESAATKTTNPNNKE